MGLLELCWGLFWGSCFALGLFWRLYKSYIRACSGDYTIGLAVEGWGWTKLLLLDLLGPLYDGFFHLFCLGVYFPFPVLEEEGVH